MSIYVNYDKNAPSIGESGLLYGLVTSSGDQHLSRISDIIYSRDIVQLLCCGDRVPAYYGKEYTNILMASPGQNQKNLMNKLRFVMITENPKNRALTPITYLSDIYIEFNPMNDPKELRLNISNTGNLSADGSNKDNIFKICNANNLNDQSILRIGSQIVIAKSSYGEENNMSYLSVDTNGQIKITDEQQNATQFIVTANTGCGPNWYYDQDVRGTDGKQFTTSDIRDMSIEAIDQLSLELKKQQDIFDNETKQYQSDCQTKINQEQRINDTMKQTLAKLRGT